MPLDRRDFLLSAGAMATLAAQPTANRAFAAEPSKADQRELRITGITITPIALPDPPLLAAGGCHGPYFLRNVIELTTDGGIVGIGETRGGEERTRGLERAKKHLVGKPLRLWRRALPESLDLDGSVFAGLELAALDALGKATNQRLCDMFGGPLLDEVEFAAYLFYRYAADHPAALSDPRLVDSRGKGAMALDDWGEVRTPAAMADLAVKFRDRFGFRVFKLKAGVLKPDEEVESLLAMNDRLGGKAPLRIDPNGRWSMATALRVAKNIRHLPLEYYEDPVAGMRAMAEVREKTGLPISTNSVVTSLGDIPEAVEMKAVDIVLADHHSFGGFANCLALGQLAPSLGWKLSQHSNNHAGITMAAMIHLGAVVPGLSYASDTHYPWLPESSDILNGGKLPIRGGKMHLPRAPGLGITLNRNALALAHETYRKCGMRERDDKATMQRYQAGWEKTIL